MICLSRLLALALLLLFLGATGAFPQATAVVQISGTVQDPNGAAVVDADVKATQTSTGFVRSAKTGPDGAYTLSSLPIGPYQIEVSVAGFKTFKQQGIVLQVNNNPVINVRLELGSTTQQIEVVANASMVEAQTTSVSQVIDQRRVVDLPLNRPPADATGITVWRCRNRPAQRFGQQQELFFFDNHFRGWRSGEWHLLSPGWRRS
jgi:carboxypeptidase family protein